MSKRSQSYQGLGIALGLMLGTAFGPILFGSRGAGAGIGLLLGITFGLFADQRKQASFRYAWVGLLLGAGAGLLGGLFFFNPPAFSSAISLGILIGAFGFVIGMMGDHLGGIPRYTLTGTALGAGTGTLLGLLLGLLHGQHAVLVGYGYQSLWGLPFITSYMVLLVIAGAVGMGLGAWIDASRANQPTQTTW